MHANAKYTIGYTHGTHWTLKSGRQVDYRFTVGDQTYEGGDDEAANMVRNNGRYLIKYDSLNPKWNAVYFTVPIPDSVQQAPTHGWHTPPFSVPSNVLKQQ